MALLLLSGCGYTSYSEVLNAGYTYTAKAEPKHGTDGYDWAWGASYNNQAEANKAALYYCNEYYDNLSLIHI